MPEKAKKLYYTISEAAKMTGIKAHVLRYWESEFPTLRPRKTRSGSRRYRQQDIDEILEIKKLLYDEGYRIAGAKKMRRQAQKAAKGAGAAKSQMAIPFAEMAPEAQLKHIRSELSDVMGLIRQLREDAQEEMEKAAPPKAKKAGKA